MKTLSEYFNELDPNATSTIVNTENNEMKKIIAPQNEIDEALWNSKDDKWSRNAKHPITPVELDSTIWEKGDYAIYEGQEVEILIPKGPNFTVGIAINGRTKMVKENKLTSLTEGVFGSLQALSPLNRIMQLAGLANPSASIEEETIADEQHTATLINNAVPVNEDGSNTMIDSMVNNKLSGEYRNNPPAALLATIGDILSGLSSELGNLTGKVDASILSKLNAAIGLGPQLTQAAKTMTTQTQPTTMSTSPPAT